MMTKEELKILAVSQTLFPKTTLSQAFEKLRFVQADPIRSPARAQDLILRHRVKDYRQGDLEKEYPKLELEEDYLYAHGFITRDTWQLLHPRGETDLTPFDTNVLRQVQGMSEINSKDLTEHFGSKREINWWGGYSQATKMSLEKLHYYGFVRVVRREKGNRIYQPFTPPVNTLSSSERLEQIILAVVHLLSPVVDKTLQQALHRVRRHFGETRPVIRSLVASGRLTQHTVDGVTYLLEPNNSSREESLRGVRILTPFDPIVWDRIRFEHIWGWQYRFEAYTPKEKRVRGYYAMPILWNTQVIGWANITKTGIADVGFIPGFTKNKPFTQAFELEVEQFRTFLDLS